MIIEERRETKRVLFKVSIGGEQFEQLISATQCRNVSHNQIPAGFHKKKKRKIEVNISRIDLGFRKRRNKRSGVNLDSSQIV